MKECIQLCKEKDNRYYTVYKPNPSLWHLNYFLENDYHPYKIDLFARELNFYNVTYVYNDFKNKMMYVGFAKWSVDEDIDSPSNEEFPDYLNETNSCKMSVENFKEFLKKWVVLKQELPSFAIIYRDDNDWIDCKGFNGKEDMELFVKSYQPEAIH